MKKIFSVGGQAVIQGGTLFAPGYNEHRPGEKDITRKPHGEIISFGMLHNCCHASWVSNLFFLAGRFTGFPGGNMVDGLPPVLPCCFCLLLIVVVVVVVIGLVACLR